jgi:hypothetical protein
MERLLPHCCLEVMGSLAIQHAIDELSLCVIKAKLLFGGTGVRGVIISS